MRKESWRDLNLSSEQLGFLEDLDKRITEACLNPETPSMTRDDVLVLFEKGFPGQNAGETFEITLKRFVLTLNLDVEVEDFQDFFNFALEFIAG